MNKTTTTKRNKNKTKYKKKKEKVFSNDPRTAVHISYDKGLAWVFSEDLSFKNCKCLSLSQTYLRSLLAPVSTHTVILLKSSEWTIIDTRSIYSFFLILQVFIERSGFEIRQ